MLDRVGPSSGPHDGVMGRTTSLLWAIGARTALPSTAEPAANHPLRTVRRDSEDRFSAAGIKGATRGSTGYEFLDAIEEICLNGASTRVEGKKSFMNKDKAISH